MKLTFTIFTAFIMLSACTSSEPEAIRLNKDNCDYCKMTIADLHFASELITDKGKTYKFDDVSCMINYCKEFNPSKDARLYVSDYMAPTQFLEVKKAVLAKGESVASPMGGNVAAFSNQQAAQTFAQEKNASIVQWSELY